MAFLRTEKKKSGTYIRLVEAFRENGKTRHRIIANLGKTEHYSPQMLRRIGERFYELGGGDLKELLGKSLQEKGRYCYGYVQVVQKIITHYGLDKQFKRISKKKKLSFNLLNAVILMVIERLHDPGSKRSNFFNQQEYLGLEPLSLQHLYRSLDYLAEYASLLQNSIYQTGRNLFNQQLDVVFYDVTTFYFESDKEDGFRMKGFSKDGKQGKVQILFGLLIDRYKQPIGYRIYKGDYFEGHTFEQALMQLKKDYQIANIIIVADRGMLNKNNISLTENHNGYEFIIGERLRKLPAGVKESLLDKANYSNEWEYNQDGQKIVVKYMAVEHQGRTIIGTWSEKRAEKDRKDREEAIEKAEKLLDNPSSISRKAKRMYLKNQEDEKYILDEKKIAENEKYDGFLAISTNNKELSATTILDHYRHLYQIEHSFRTFKTHLETRPMFHWTEKRIEGHICLCYITYTCLNYLLLTLNNKGISLTEKKLRTLLDKMQVSEIIQNNQSYFLRASLGDETKKILRALGITILPNILSKDHIISYLK